jgi:hypothetical protein
VKNSFSPSSSIPVRYPNVADRPTRAAGADRLHHRLLRANTLQYRIGAHSVGHISDASNTLLPTLGHNVGRAELESKLLPRYVPAHHNDSFCAPLPGGEHSEQSDRAVADHCDRRSRLHIRGIGSEPARAHHIGERQQTRDQVFCGKIRRGH